MMRMRWFEDTVIAEMRWTKEEETVVAKNQQERKR